MADLTQSQEDELTAYVQAMYAVWLPVASTAVLAGYNRFGAAPNPDAITATTPVWREQIQQMETEQLEPIAEENYDSETEGVAGAATFAIGGILLGGVAAATLAFLLAQVGEIQGQLQAILRGSRSVAEAARLISEYLNPANSHWAFKSRQVAQTEGDRWSQAGTLAGAVAAQRADGVQRVKVWVTRHDSRVRDAHVVTDGQRRPLGEPFNVVGFPMMFPLDPNAPPELIVNCRCGMRILKVGATRGR